MAGNSENTYAEVEHDGFTVASTTTSADDLRKELAQSEKRDDDGKAADAPGPSPQDVKADETKSPQGSPQPSGDTPNPNDPAAPATEKKDKSPEGRVKEIRAQINAATREKHEVIGQTEAAKAERAAIQAEIDAAKKELAELKVKPADKPEPAVNPGRKPEPQEDDFVDTRDYFKALGQWTREEARLDALEAVGQYRQKEADAEKERTERDQFEQRLAAERRVAEQHTTRLEAFKKANPGFDELMKESQHLPTNPEIMAYVVNSENGPAMMQYLAENPEECERIAALGGGPTLVELGKIEATKLSSANTGSEPQRQSVTKARPPISPVGGSAPVADDAEDPSTMEFGPRYVAVMNAREAERKRSRRL